MITLDHLHYDHDRLCSKYASELVHLMHGILQVMSFDYLRDAQEGDVDPNFRINSPHSISAMKRLGYASFLRAALAPFTTVER